MDTNHGLSLTGAMGDLFSNDQMVNTLDADAYYQKKGVDNFVGQFPRHVLKLIDLANDKQTLPGSNPFLTNLTTPRPSSILSNPATPWVSLSLRNNHQRHLLSPPWRASIKTIRKSQNSPFHHKPRCLPIPPISPRTTDDSLPLPPTAAALAVVLLPVVLTMILRGGVLTPSAVGPSKT